MVLKTKGKKEWMSFTGQNEGRQFDPLANLDAKLSKYLLHLNNIVWITAAMGPFFSWFVYSARRTEATGKND